MRIGLVTDSVSDIPAELIHAFEIEIVPAVLVMDGQQYQDGKNITRAEFYARLPGLKNSPTTAAAAPGDFIRSYKALLRAGCEHVIGIFTSTKLTGTAQIAEKAAEEFKDQVTVVESGSISMGSGYQVLAAAKAISNGSTLTETLNSIRSVRGRLKVYAGLDTMEYLRRSGRISSTVAKLGGMLNIKPVLELKEGMIIPVGAARTTQNANQILFDILSDLLPAEQLSILHTNTEKRAEYFVSKLKENVKNLLPQHINIVNVTTAIGTHLGPNGLGFVLVKNEA